MPGPRPLKEEELQYLRRLAMRRGLPATVWIKDVSVHRFLHKRGLVEDEDAVISSGASITREGMIEVAKSGRFTPYDPALIMDRYNAILSKLKAKLSGMALRVVGLQEWFNPDEPWELIRNLTFLRTEQNLWRSSSWFAPVGLLAEVQNWLEAELRGADGYKDNLYEALVAELNKE
jgi:hypothetical protein